MPDNKDFKRRVRQRMGSTSQSYSTARRFVLASDDHDGSAVDNVAHTTIDDPLGDVVGPGPGPVLDELGLHAVARVRGEGVLLCGAHAGVAETGSLMDWVVAQADVDTVLLAWPRSWQPVVDGLLAGRRPTAFPDEPSDATHGVLLALQDLGRRGLASARCVGMTPEPSSSASSWDEAIGRMAESITALRSPTAATLVLIRPFNLCLVPYEFRGENALPWSDPTARLFEDADVIHPLGAQLAARGQRVASLQFFGPDAPDPHDLRPRLGIGVAMSPTWTKSPPLP